MPLSGNGRVMQLGRSATHTGSAPPNYLLEKFRLKAQSKDLRLENGSFRICELQKLKQMSGSGTDKTKSGVDADRARDDSGRAAARREHRHGRARDGQFRARPSCASSIRATAGRTSRASAPPPAPTVCSSGASCSTPSRRRSPICTLRVRHHRAGARPGQAGGGARGGRAGDRGRHVGGGGKVGILFGRERWGLQNEEVALADRIVTFPVNPGFASLNLAQAVLLIGYEWFKLSTGGALPFAMPEHSGRATQQQVQAFFDNLVRELDSVEFLRPARKARHHAGQPAQHLSPAWSRPSRTCRRCTAR